MAANEAALGERNATNVLLSIEERRAAESKQAAYLQAMLLLIPLAACLFSMLLCVESHAFECAIIAPGTN
jgi:hypothetical protein